MRTIANLNRSESCYSMIALAFPESYRLLPNVRSENVAYGRRILFYFSRLKIRTINTLSSRNVARQMSVKGFKKKIPTRTSVIHLWPVENLHGKNQPVILSSNQFDYNIFWGHTCSHLKFLWPVARNRARRYNRRPISYL